MAGKIQVSALAVLAPRFHNVVAAGRLELLPGDEDAADAPSSYTCSNITASGSNCKSKEN